MYRCLTAFALLTFTPSLRGDAFDHYTNPILGKVPGAAGVQEVKRLTPELIAEHARVLPNLTAAVIVVRTNDGRNAKLLVQAARQKTETGMIPMLLIERFVTYREGQERAVQAHGQNVYLFPGFRFSLDIGQVVPEGVGGDLRFGFEGEKAITKVFAEPLGKAKIYLLTKPIPEAAPKKAEKLTVGEVFEPRYFNGKYRLHDDGRRSGELVLKVADDGAVTGSYYSDKDGRKYDVIGKVGTPKHSVQFTVKFPRTEQVFQGWLFTGDGKALTGWSRLQERETGFYAVRVEE